MPIHLIPQPNTIRTEPGFYELSPNSAFVAPQEAQPAAEILAATFRQSTGWNLPVQVLGEQTVPRGAIVLTDLAAQAALGPEGYNLKVTPSQVIIRANTPTGLLYGGQTLRQLFPPEIECQAPVTGVSWQAPCVEIEDSPRFPWRGLHLDTGRHFFPMAFIKKLLDLMLMHKLNVFHWHLTDDQGWRVEVKKYPRLVEIGSQRAASPLPHDPGVLDNLPHGGFYTQEEMAQVVAYARQRAITVVPEIEMPGHSCAALSSYPELGCTGGPYAVRKYWGIEEDVFCAGNEQTFTFLEGVLDEVLAIFPGEFIHIGGDECPKERWKACPKCQQRIRSEGLKDENELQSYFIRRIETYLSSKGRRLIGWDEILEGGLAQGATVMSWRGIEGGIQAAQAGHDVVMTPSEYCYLDYYQSEDKDKEPPAAFWAVLPLEKSYSFEPVPPLLTQTEARHILGIQGNIWTEFIPTTQQVEYQAFPRACALSEVAWSAQEDKQWDRFQVRLAVLLERLQWLGVNFRKL